MVSPNYSFPSSISGAPEEGRWLPVWPLAPVGARLHLPVGMALPKWGEREGGEMDCHPTNPRSALDKRAHFREDPALSYCRLRERLCVCRSWKRKSDLFFVCFFSWSKFEDANHFVERSRALLSRKVSIRTRRGEWREGHGPRMKALKMDADTWSFCNQRGSW